MNVIRLTSGDTFLVQENDRQIISAIEVGKILFGFEGTMLTKDNMPARINASEIACWWPDSVVRKAEWDMEASNGALAAPQKRARRLFA